MCAAEYIEHMPKHLIVRWWIVAAVLAGTPLCLAQTRSKVVKRAQPPKVPKAPCHSPAEHDPTQQRTVFCDGVRQFVEQQWFDAWKI